MMSLDALKAEGIEMFGDVGAWAYDEWSRLNEAYFNGENTPGPVY
jgi:hypothetical protein